jgi:hypothetical protein
MAYRILADLIVLSHIVFVVFAVLGGLLVIRWRRVIWAHIPAALWAVWIEYMGWICPLTPLENWLRTKSGETAYADSFIEHYLLPLLYPANLTRNLQMVLGTFALVVNLGIYWRIYLRK